MEQFKYGVDRLTVAKAIKLREGELKGVISEEAKTNIAISRKLVDEIVTGEKTVYGINTGFGPLCDSYAFG